MAVPFSQLTILNTKGLLAVITKYRCNFASNKSHLLNHKWVSVVKPKLKSAKGGETPAPTHRPDKMEIMKQLSWRSSLESLEDH